MNYYTDQKGIMRRYRREKKNWDNHLEKTKQVIIKNIPNNTECVEILGSGWLLDVPLESLQNKCKKIILTDISHPKQILNKYKTNTKIEFKTADITKGSIEDVFNNMTQKEKHAPHDILEKISKNIYQPSQETNLVVSVNLMSQLGVFLKDFNKSKKTISESQLDIYIQQIEKNHLKMLSSYPSILITDFEEELYDEENKLAGINPLLKANTTLGEKIDDWKWIFDTQFLYHTDFQTIFNVKAIKHKL